MRIILFISLFLTFVHSDISDCQCTGIWESGEPSQTVSSSGYTTQPAVSEPHLICTPESQYYTRSFSVELDGGFYGDKPTYQILSTITIDKCVKCTDPDTPFPDMDTELYTYENVWKTTDTYADTYFQECTDSDGEIEYAYLECEGYNRCKLPKINSECGENQHNNSTDVEVIKCSCDDGFLPEYNLNGDLTCIAPECPPYDGDLPLYAQSVSIEYCQNLSNEIFQFNTTFYEENGQSCCYSDAPTESGDDCPPNHLSNVYGECTEIEPSDTPEDNSTNPNTDIPDTTDGTGTPTDGTDGTDGVDGTNGGTGTTDGTDGTGTGGSGTTDGTDGTGTVGGTDDGTGTTDGTDGEPDIPTDEPGTDSGGGSEFPFDSIQIENDFDGGEGFFDDLFNSDVANYSSTVLTGLDGLVGSFVSIHSVQIPRPNSDGCGCTDQEIGGAVYGKTFTKKIEACQYIQTVFEYISYLLWLIVSYSLIIKIREII